MERRSCKACGSPVVVIPVSATAPILCDCHAWTAQQEQAERERSRAAPPAEAYREVRLEENWR
jgi:hypothetical protein